jgi:hypothetical protein
MLRPRLNCWSVQSRGCIGPSFGGQSDESDSWLVPSNSPGVASFRCKLRQSQSTGYIRANFIKNKQDLLTTLSYTSS